MATASPVVGIDVPGYRRYLLPLVSSTLLLLFLAAPWSLEHKTHVALHGLCAQRPSHSFSFGAQRLPFDARMTGIYSGFIVTALYLLARGRARATDIPRRSLVVLLGLGVFAMAVDGFNSLVLDLGYRHLYQPHNAYRLITGTATGIALSCVLGYLVAVTLWRRPDASVAVVASNREFALIWLLQVPVMLCVLGGASWLYEPLLLLLILSALSVLSTLALVVSLLLKRVDCQFDRFGQLQVHAVVAVGIGVLTMASLSALRFLLEWWTGAPTLT